MSEIRTKIAQKIASAASIDALLETKLTVAEFSAISCCSVSEIIMAAEHVLGEKKGVAVKPAEPEKAVKTEPKPEKKQEVEEEAHPAKHRGRPRKEEVAAKKPSPKEDDWDDEDEPKKPAPKAKKKEEDWDEEDEPKISKKDLSKKPAPKKVEDDDDDWSDLDDDEDDDTGDDDDTDDVDLDWDDDDSGN